MPWTEAQLQVISSDAGKLICSAAAGSGKTAVLVERIIRFLKQGASPDSFLIITFTNAAASEMREKIRERIQNESQNPYLRAAMDQMDLMQISTIHAFCQRIIREWFSSVEMDPLFTVCDQGLKQKLFHESFCEACDELEAETNPCYERLRARFEEKKAEKLIVKLHHFIMSLPNPMEWVECSIREIPETASQDHVWFKLLRSMTESHLHSADILLNRMEKMLEDSFALESYRAVYQNDLALFHVKQCAVKDQEASIQETVFMKLPTPRGLNPQEMDWKDRYQALRKSWKEEISDLDDLMMIRPETHLAEWKNMKESLESLSEVLKRTESIFQRKKKMRAVVDLNDLEQYAVRILSDEKICSEMRSTWRHIFVDECQDVSAVQHWLIERLYHLDNHLFMVGDVKQSIYRFRLADPTLFMEQIQSCGADAGPGTECIYLQNNFRSRPEILETTNIVFRSVMKKNVTELDYSAQDELIAGRKTEGFCPVQAVQVFSEDDNKTNSEKTADFLAAEIHELLQMFYPAENRNYRFRDCVILMPAAATDAPLLSALLKERGIPVFYDGAGHYYQQKEIQLMKNLLEWIDNPIQDIPLLSVLQNLPFSFSDEKLGQIRLRCPEKEASFYDAFSRVCEEEGELGEECRQVRQQHHRWQEMSETVPLSDLIWTVMQETGYYWSLSTEPDGETKQANLRILAEEALLGEKNGILTLRQFLNVMRERQDSGDAKTSTLLGDQDDLVRIMTIHQSKGLQFPAVFCCGMDQEMVKSEAGGLQCHTSLGLCIEYKDPEHRISRKTLASDLFAWQRNREELAEKVRLLYVAMTRAQERLYLITCQDVNPLWSMPETDGRILSAKSFTDLWMPVLMQHHSENLSTGYAQGANPYIIRTFMDITQQFVENRKVFHNMENWLKSVISEPVVDELWKDHFEASTETLIKRSVTSLIRSARQGLREEDEEENPEIKRTPEALMRKLSKLELPELPPFMREKGKISATWRGTMAHRILSAIDLAALREGLPAEKAMDLIRTKMLENHMLSPEEASQIPEDRICAFLESPLGRRMIYADEVHREWNFNLRVRRDREIILQGVIDCAFREPAGWVILDYKTDRVEDPEAFVNEYTPQMMWYVRALSELTGQPVREAYLYSLSLDRPFLLPLNDGNLGEAEGII